MSSENHINNIAIVGASGQLGSQLVSHLLSASRFQITAISRSSSNASFPPGVKVCKGDYSSPSFLQAALREQDVVIIAFGFEAPLDLQECIIDAAGKAGVKWILPNEWSSDGENEKLCKVFSLLGEKRKFREQIERLDLDGGRGGWVGVANNPWFDYSLKSGWFGINISSRKVTLFDDGNTPITTTTIPQVCRGVTALLSLPIYPSASSLSSPCLSDYRNKYLYLSSFIITQREIFKEVLKTTRTEEGEWEIENKGTEEYIEEGLKEKEQGGELGIVKVLYGCTFKRGLGDRFYGREDGGERLSLEKEVVGEVVERVAREVEVETK